MPRRCSACGQTGHNKSTCKDKNKPIVSPQSTSSLSAAKKKEKELGHAILAEKKKKVEREEIDGLTPQKGFWVVHHKRQKIAGKIVQVKRNGKVLWKGAIGAITATPQEVFKQEGYSYIEDLEPEMLRWKVI